MRTTYAGRESYRIDDPKACGNLYESGTQTLGVLAADPNGDNCILADRATDLVLD